MLTYIKIIWFFWFSQIEGEMNESKGKIVATKDTVNGLNAKLEPVEVMKADFVYITFTYCTMIIHRLPLQV